MQKTGKILKTLVWGNAVSLAVLNTTALVNEAIKRHSLTPVCAAALGRAMTACAYLCSWLKDGESSLSMTFDGGGAGGKVCVAGDGELNIRGFLENPNCVLPPRADGKLDVGGCVGKNGYLTVIRDDGSGLPFTGSCALLTGEIAEDLSAYFLTSEQRPTAVALGVRIGTDGTCIGAGGVFLQPLPGASEEILRRTEEEIAKYSSISALIAVKGAEEVLRSIENTHYEGREVRFRCRCSREKSEAAVLTLGREDALDLIARQGKISVHCHYCNTEYAFTEEETKKLFGEE
ncbi:MAG: Hsp33 family molecular chaperone HslO [Clostridia bacterium]|nr:Hsp33 family molecular chaperone HslO [Clostridia bacterium]